MRDGESIRASDVRYLPIVPAFSRTIGVVEEVDRLCGHKNGISPGSIVLALMVDALSGRTPLFRLPQAFAKLDTELLLGEAISPEKLNDDAVGRALDRIFDLGTSKVLAAMARARKEAGCFVLITNEPEEAVGGLSSNELLRAYQDQHYLFERYDTILPWRLGERLPSAPVKTVASAHDPSEDDFRVPV